MMTDPRKFVYEHPNELIDIDESGPLHVPTIEELEASAVPDEDLPPDDESA